MSSAKPLTHKEKFEALLLRLEKLLSVRTQKIGGDPATDKMYILELQNKNLQEELFLLKNQLFEASKEIHALKGKNEGAKQELSNIISELELCQK